MVGFAVDRFARAGLPLAAMVRRPSVRHDRRLALRCVIVDDSPDLLAAASELLERGDITVVGVASTVAEGLAGVEALRPDFTLIDIDLGIESGFELARRLDGGDIPSILISSHAERDFIDLIEASPAVGFIPKSELSAETIRSLIDSTRTAGGS